VSGRINDRVAARLARFGRGWIPWGEDARDLTESIPRMRDALARAGREPAGLQVAGTLPLARREDKVMDLGATMGRLPLLVEAGVTDFRAYLPIPDSYDGAAEYLREVVVAFREATDR
jgi:hypothetical protein